MAQESGKHKEQDEGLPQLQQYHCPDALTEVLDMLNGMVALAEQSADGTSCILGQDMLQYTTNQAPQTEQKEPVSPHGRTSPEKLHSPITGGQPLSRAARGGAGGQGCPFARLGP